MVPNYKEINKILKKKQNAAKKFFRTPGLQFYTKKKLRISLTN